MYTSVIVPTFNRRQTLECTLDALLKQTAPSDSFEIIVVDDCSSDDTQAYMERLIDSVSNVTYLRHRENQGRAVTRNDGIIAARGDIIVFLDGDIVPEPCFMEAHQEYHAKYSGEHIVVMGNVYYAQESISGSNFGRYQQSRYLGCRSLKQRVGIDYSNLPAFYLGTGNCSMRRVDLLAADMLDATFRYYGGEDGYLGYRLKQIGARIMFGENARAVHYDDVSLTRYKLKMRELAQGGIIILLEKSPEFFEDTPIRFLLPIEWEKDSRMRIVAKLGFRALLNSFTIFMLERWVFMVDHFEWFYSPPLYRLLIAGWTLQGLNSKRIEIKSVTGGAQRAI